MGQALDCVSCYHKLMCVQTWDYAMLCRALSNTMEAAPNPTSFIAWALHELFRVRPSQARPISCWVNPAKATTPEGCSSSRYFALLISDVKVLNLNLLHLETRSEWCFVSALTYIDLFLVLDLHKASVRGIEKGYRCIWGILCCRILVLYQHQNFEDLCIWFHLFSVSYAS